MTRRITADGPSLEAALIAAVAELADCDPEKVDLRVDAPGLDATEGPDVSVQLRVTEPHSTAHEDESHSAERDDEEDEDSGDEISEEHLDEEADAAADFMEELLDRMGLPGDLKIRLFEDYAEVEVVDVGSGALIGRRGQTLEAIQELLRCALQREFQRRCRVKVDVEGYRVRRFEKLREKALEAIEAVQDTGDSERLEPMDVFERKAIHHLVAEHEGVTSRSQGREPGRRIVIEPDDE